jgi:hypothetical protein
MNPPGISIQVSSPLAVAGGYFETILRPKAYSHSIHAVGGYWSLTMSLATSIDKMDDWIAEGLGRHIEVHNDALEICWAGFVNQIDASYGPLSVTRGPLLDVANRVDVVFAGVDVTVIPPTTGVQTATGVADDADSQALYGIVPKILTPGGVSATDAARIRDTFLEEHKLPVTSHDFSSAGAPPTSLTLHCLGYVHWLMWPYNQVVSVGTVNASAKITTVLAADPNLAWLAWDTTGVDTNTLQVFRYEYEDNLAWDILKDTAARGDANDDRWLIGVYADRAVRYELAPSTVEYNMMLSDPAKRVTTESGTEVPYWDVLPGKWLLFTDFLPGRAIPSSLREDPRAAFLESVTFTAPNTLMFKGGKYDTLSQMIAALGLGGIGA